MATSKKWTYTTGGFPQCLRQTTFTPPATLKPTEIQIANKAFALNPVDIQAMNLYNTATSYLPWPLSTLTSHDKKDEAEGREVCCDFSGTVTQAGPESGYQVGDQVFGFSTSITNNIGTATTHLTLDTLSPTLAIARKPPAWSHIHAAALPLVWLTATATINAVQAHLSSSSHPPNLVVVVVLGGASATGMHTIRLAKARSSTTRVLATCSARNVAFVRDVVGADEVVDYTAVSSVGDAIAARLGGSDEEQQLVVVDCVGGTEVLEHRELAKRVVRYVTIVGDKTDRASMGGPAVYPQYPRMVWRWAMGRLGLGVSYDCVILEPRKEWLEEAGEMLAESDIVVDSTFQFDEMPQAMEKLVGGRVRGKLVGVVVDNGSQ